MSDGPIAGALTFSTALDNSDLEKGLKEAEKRVDELKKKLEKKEAEKSAIEQQMEGAQAALAEASAKADELRERMQYLQSIDISNEQWSLSQREIEALTEKLREAEAEEDKLVEEDQGLTQKWLDASQAVDGYSDQLKAAEAEQSSLAERVSSVYYQAGVKVRESFNSMTSAVSQFGHRIGTLLQQTFVFSTFTAVLRALRQGISDALMQNTQFSASWEQLSATVQGFANGIANVVAPVISQVVNAISASVVSLARVIDTVLGTGLVSAIGASRKASEEAWRQTDESKAATKEAEKNAKAKAKQDEQYAKAAERQKKREEQAAERLADAQEKAAKRQAKAEQRYPDALEDAAERQAKAEEDMRKRIEKAERNAAERQAKAEESAQERYQKAVESAAKRQTKAEESAAERTAAAQEAYEKRVAAAQERSSKAAERAEKRRTKQAERLEKAQKKANQTLLGFDEINKLNEESTADASAEIEDYSSALEDIEPPKTYAVDYEDYAVDPSDYVIDPKDYDIDYEDYQIDPERFFVDPEDYTFDPLDYWIDPEDYAIEALEFDWQDFPGIDPTAALKPTWDALDTSKITDQMVALEAVLAGLMIALGAILAFSGINIPLGIALMAAGALGLVPVVAENWQQLPAEVRDAITGALTITGIVLLVLGAVLAFSEVNIPIGVGMMAAGAALLGYMAVLNWDGMSPQLQAVLTTLMGVVAGFLFAMGVVLCMAGQIPYGIGLIIAGFAVVATMAALNWDSLQGTMSEKLGVIANIVAGVLFGIGVMVCLMGHPAIGIGLMVAGIALIGVTQAIVNWDTLGPMLEKHVNDILAIAMYGLFAIGVILLLTGNAPLGIGCIVGSVIAGVTLAAINWDTLGPLLEQHINEILGVAMVGLFAIGVILILLHMLPLGIGCIVAATITGVTLAAINWDTLGPILEQHVNQILGVAMAGLFAIGVILCLLHMLPLGIGCIAAATIAGVTLAVINWETLGPLLEKHVNGILGVAMVGLFAIGVILCLLNILPLGIGCIAAATIAGVTLAAINWETLKTTLETHLNDILATTMTFLFVIGVVLCLVGNFPLGIGCIVAATIEGVTLAVINWDFIMEKVKEIWGKVKQWWNNNVAPIFTAEWWGKLFKSIFNGLIGVLNSMGKAIGGWLDDLSYNLGEIVGASGGTYNAPAIRIPNIPPLAQGAVIPPNRKFMALLGDQTHGNNIETPEELMRQVVREEAGGMMAEMMMQMQAQSSASSDGGDLIVPLIVDSEELARAVFRGQGRLSRRGMASLELDFT